MRPTVLDPGASPLAFFGNEVRRARETAEMTQAELADLIPCSRATVSRVEAGTTPPDEGFAAACDAAFPSMGGFFGRFMSHAPRWGGPYPPWFRDWVEVEQTAAVLRWWEPLLIPGLLQTEAYARAVIASSPDSESEIDAIIDARMKRQSILDAETPPRLVVLLHEAVLQSVIGSDEIMREQLGHLAKTAERPRITVQVVPAGYAGLTGAFTIASDGTSDIAAHLETSVQGMTMRDPIIVARVVSLFDHLRGEALPRAQSLELINKAGEACNTR